MAYRWGPKQHEKESSYPKSGGLYDFLVRVIVPTMNDCIQSFQFTATNFVSMVVKSSGLVDKMSGANLQVDGHVEVPTQGGKDQWEPEEEESSPTHSLSSSPAQRLLASFPNMKYCLEIRVMLTEELGAIPPPYHSWTAPLVEDMLHEARTWLTKAVVIGPDRAVLFYQRCSMGEGLRVRRG